MTETMFGYDGREIRGARSRRSGVFAAYDWKDMVVGSTTGAIQKKVREKADAELANFPVGERRALSQVLGHYSRIQSIRSEDAVTWSVFQGNLDKWLSGLLDELFPGTAHPSAWGAEFWIRSPHPDTGNIVHGPEADAILHATGWRYVVEAKWLADIDGDQGTARAATQLDFRSYVARLDTGEERQSGVIVVTPRPNLYPPARNEKSVFRRYFEVDGERYRPTGLADELDARAVTWEEISQRLAQVTELGNVVKYLEWKTRAIDC